MTDICVSREKWPSLSVCWQNWCILPNHLRQDWTSLHCCNRLPVSSGTVIQDQYKLHFEQSFRFDVSGQLPYIYRAVQMFLASVCRELATQIHHNWIPHVNFTQFNNIRLYSEQRRRSHSTAVQRGNSDFQEAMGWAGIRKVGAGVENVTSLSLSYPF